MSATNTLNCIRLSDRLRAANPEQLVYEYGDAFCPTPESMPVLICARDEQDDLPATLAALAIGGEDVHPIVIDNGSNDRTTEFAIKMGARVLFETLPSKTAAFQTGLHFVSTETSATTVLSTDADTITGKHWAASMEHAVSDFPDDVGGLVFGLSIVRHGDSNVTDHIRTALLNTKQVLAKIRNKRPGNRGNNMAIKFDDSDRILTEIANIPPLTFPGADRAQRDAVEDAGGIVRAHIDLNGAVVTRGDRFNSVTQYIAVQMGLITPAEHYGTIGTNTPHKLSKPR